MAVKSNSKSNIVEADIIQSGIDGQAIIANNVLEYLAPFDVSGNQLVFADWVIAKLAAVGASRLEVEFTAVTNMVIDWQADMPDGYDNTYAEIFGNLPPNPQVWALTGGADAEKRQIARGVSYTESAGLILILTLDWAIEQTGIIVF